MSDQPEPKQEAAPKARGGARAGAGRKKKPKLIGRPPRGIDPELFEKLSAMQCTQEEIAGVLKMSRENLRLRMHADEKLRFVWECAQAAGKASVRRILFKLAEAGNVAAAIFLAKNFCGMRDVVEQQHTGKDGAEMLSLESIRKVLKAADGAAHETEDVRDQRTAIN